ncbi:hypothetical protein VE04_06109 [Pseudogymnoascus sp. 24MN13]|nr:hypothetical protein VE04_06109 [Pseudogymnoascus sp. 24MN13]
MAGYKRPRCESESPADAEQSSGSVGAKKSKTTNGEAKSPKRPRPPRTLEEKQKLNWLDQEEYVKMKNKLSRPGIHNLELESLARREFWAKFYATSEEDTFPEDQSEKLNSLGRDTVKERRKSCPWYVWGHDGYARQKYPEEWTCFYEEGEKKDIYLGSPLHFDGEGTQNMSAESSGANSFIDKTGAFALSLNELEKAIEDNEKEISRETSLLDKKRAESYAMRKKATEFKTKSDTFSQKIIEFNTKFVDSSKKATEFNKEADKLTTEVVRSDETLKQKQALLKVQKLVLAARRANDRYDNQ